MQRYHRDEYDDMDEYEEEYEDEEEEGGGEEEYQEEPAQPTQEELEYLELRKRLKESIRKQMKKESGSSLTNSEQRKKKLPYENFGSFFGPSQPVISQRVIQESKSILENPHLAAKVMTSEHDKNRRHPSTATQSKTQIQQRRRPNAVNELKTKVQKLKDTRDYSFLLSDDSNVPPPAKNPPSRTASASHSEPRATGNLPVKSKQSVSNNTGRQLQNGHQDRRPIMTSSQKHPKPPVVEKSSSTSKVPRPSVDPRRQMAKSNGSGPGRPQGGRDLASSRVTASSGDRRTLPTGSKSSMPSSHKPPPPKMQSSAPKKPPVVKQPLNGRKEHMESSRGKIPPKQPISSSKPQMKKAPANSAARPPVRVDRPKKRPSRPYSDDDENEDEAALAMIRSMFKYNPNKFADDGDDSDMEANFDEIQREEKRSLRIARKEDEEELRKIEEEEERERLRKEAKRRKLSQR